jgi:hypothetical protein
MTDSRLTRFGDFERVGETEPWFMLVYVMEEGCYLTRRFSFLPLAMRKQT